MNSLKIYLPEWFHFNYFLQGVRIGYSDARGEIRAPLKSRMIIFA